MENTSGITQEQLRAYGLSAEPLSWVPESIRSLVGVLRSANNDPSNTALATAANDMIAQFDSTFSDVLLSAPVVGTIGAAPTVDGLVVELTADDSELGLPADHFRWTFGDGLAGSGDQVTHEYLTPGDYRVTLEVSVAGVTYRDHTHVTVVSEPDDEPTQFDPGDHNIQEVKDYINGLPDAGVNDPETQRVLDAERDGDDRSTLVDWLVGKVEQD